MATKPRFDLVRVEPVEPSERYPLGRRVIVQTEDGSDVDHDAWDVYRDWLDDMHGSSTARCSSVIEDLLEDSCAFDERSCLAIDLVVRSGWLVALQREARDLQRTPRGTLERTHGDDLAALLARARKRLTVEPDERRGRGGLRGARRIPA